MDFCVYILYSLSTNSFYKGQTSDLTDRLYRHNNQFEKATTSGTPWLLLWSAKKASRSEAILLERKLKNLSRKRIIDFIIKYPEGVAGPDALLIIEQWSGY